MPADIFAALSAFVRAEATRNAPRPDSPPAVPADPSVPHSPPAVTSVPPQHTPPSAGPDHTTALSPPAPAARRRPRFPLLRGLLTLLASAVRRRGKGSTAEHCSADRDPAPDS